MGVIDEYLDLQRQMQEMIIAGQDDTSEGEALLVKLNEIGQYLTDDELEQTHPRLRPSK